MHAAKLSRQQQFFHCRFLSARFSIRLSNQPTVNIDLFFESRWQFYMSSISATLACCFILIVSVLITVNSTSSITCQSKVPPFHSKSTPSAEWLSNVYILVLLFWMLEIRNVSKRSCSVWQYFHTAVSGFFLIFFWMRKYIPPVVCKAF